MFRRDAMVPPAEVDAPGSRIVPAPATLRPAAPAPVQALRDAAQGALIESRQRWRDIVAMATDLAFETDAEGRITFLSPDPVLGWPAAALLGRRPVEDGLLLRPEPDPFSCRQPVRDLRAWLRRADGEPACLSFVATPLLGPDGCFLGLRGAARDVTAGVAEAEAEAAALRRALAVQALVRRVREAVLMPRMLPALLDLLPAAIGCAGAVLVELGADGWPVPPGPRDAGRPQGDAAARPPCLAPGPPQRDGPGRAAPSLAPGGPPVFTRGAGGEPVALVPQAASADPALPGRDDGTASPAQALLVWREAGARPFDADERHLLEALSDLLGVVLGNQRLLLELERQARTDGLTGLLNRRAFLEDLHRRLDRLQRDGGGGALLFLDVDNLKPVNDRLGHEAGDALLQGVAALLGRTARATDLAARLGGDEFALWLDGVTSEAVATGRADALCAEAAALRLPSQGPGGGGLPAGIGIGISIGVALAGGAEAAEAVLARADQALYAAKRAGRNAWRLAPAASPGPA